MIKRFLPLALLVIATIVLAFLVQDFVRQVIVVPVLYAGWFIWLILTNLPQWVFWTLLTLGAIVMAARSLSGRQRKVARPAEPPPVGKGPVTAWTHRLKQVSSQASSQTSSQWRVSRDLGRFFWETHFPAEPYHIQHFVDKLSDSNTKLPAEIRDYFLAGAQRPPTARSVLFFRRTPPSSPALALDPEIVVDFLENQLSPEHEQVDL